MNIETSRLTQRFLDALNYAFQLHGADLKKGTTTPYMAHLLGVSALVLNNDGSEDEAIAALLHDVLEDHPTEASREVIEKRFGVHVLAIVETCTDTPTDYEGGPKPPWIQRKSRYLEHIEQMEADQLRVSLADKLDNVRSVLVDYRRIGDDLWARFNAGKEYQLWYFRSLTHAFRSAGVTGFLIDEFERTVAELEMIAGTS